MKQSYELHSDSQIPVKFICTTSTSDGDFNDCDRQLDRPHELGKLVDTTATILLIDDEEQTLDLMERKLTIEGHNILKAPSGRQGIQMMERNDVDLVICDMSMPEMDGFEVLDTIKNKPEFRHIPVIMLSAHDDVDAIVMCIRNGADDYLVKPSNNVLMRARVKMH